MCQVHKIKSNYAYIALKGTYILQEQSKVSYDLFFVNLVSIQSIWTVHIFSINPAAFRTNTRRQAMPIEPEARRTRQPPTRNRRAAQQHIRDRAGEWAIRAAVASTIDLTGRTD